MQYLLEERIHVCDNNHARNVWLSKSLNLNVSIRDILKKHPEDILPTISIKSNPSIIFCGNLPYFILIIIGNRGRFSQDKDSLSLRRHLHIFQLKTIESSSLHYAGRTLNIQKNMRYSATSKKYSTCLTSTLMMCYIHHVLYSTTISTFNLILTKM